MKYAAAAAGVVKELCSVDGSAVVAGAVTEAVAPAVDWGRVTGGGAAVVTADASLASETVATTACVVAGASETGVEAGSDKALTDAAGVVSLAGVAGEREALPDVLSGED